MAKNPVMKEEIFTQFRDMAAESGVMTVNGTIQKTGILLGIVILFAVPGWVFASLPALVISAVIAIGLSFAIAFNRQKAGILAPIYAVFEGIFVGTFSQFVYQQLKDTKYGNAIPLAILGTLCTLGVMLVLYRTRIIKVTETFKAVVLGLTAAVAITYLVSFVAWMIVPNMVNGLSIYGSGPIGIGFSIFVIGLAAFNFLLDFNMIETGVESGAPKFMEWYAAFGLMVTIVWLYLEILRLLMKLARR